MTAVTLAQPSPIDWPQWRGPERDGISRETGLLKQWPSGGPQQIWLNANLGPGYGSVAVQGERIYVQFALAKNSAVGAINRADGRIVWAKVLGQGGTNDRGSGPRGTPTVDGDRLYALTESGDLACLEIADGAIVWQRNILQDFRGQNINWLISESPLVDGDKVIVTPGGSRAGMVALDKMTGKTLWTSEGIGEAGYASAIVADIGGVRTLMTLTSTAGVGIRESDGKVMWRYTKAANNTANIATPIFSDNKVFYTSAYGTGGALLNLTARDGMVSARESYFTSDMQNHHGGVVLVGGYLYGFHNSILTCLEFATGKMMWRNRSVGKGSLSYADGNLYILSEDNVVGLVEATSADYREKGRFKIPDRGFPSWAHPVVSGGRLYIRNQMTLASYDVQLK
ncbi:MAG TPA: PQQ-binding-like beta-propeller repeat protein [Terriglobia bacterium]|nr:PQQ-binding-like beta-propeller repeat protein [Terriglobia bacterium]